jgi:hypothetical protein
LTRQNSSKAGLDQDDTNPEPPAELLCQWQERAGQIDGIFLQWVASGPVFLDDAVRSWKQELEKLEENWAEEQDAQRTDMYRVVRVPITHLAERLERESEYGAEQPIHAAPWAGPSWADALILQETSRLVRDNAQAEYSNTHGPAWMSLLGRTRQPALAGGLHRQGPDSGGSKFSH